MENGLLYQHWHDLPGNSRPHLQLLVTRKCIADILHSLHDHHSAGHLGIAKTLNKVLERFYWPGLRRDVVDWCKSCHTCASHKSSLKAPLTSDFTGTPFQRIAIDIVGPFPVTTRNNKYILVVNDYFTKWRESLPLPAPTVALCLASDVLCRFGMPSRIHTDQGQNFESVLFQELCSLFGIKKTRTTPYHAQSDGQAERFNRTLLSMLNLCCKLLGIFVYHSLCWHLVQVYRYDFI